MTTFLRRLSLVFAASMAFAVSAFAGTAKTIHLDEKNIAPVTISSRGTVLSFPIKPSKVILGRSGTFGIEYIESDLAISPLSSNARSNLFVYIYGRRFSFDLTTSMNEGSSVILVRDELSVPPKKTGKSK